MNLLIIIAAFVIGVVAFGILVVGMLFLPKVLHLKIPQKYGALILPAISLLPAIVLFLFVDIKTAIFNFSGAADPIYLAITALTVIAVSVLMSFKKPAKVLSYGEILHDAACGMTMEIPQRIFMQTLLSAFLSLCGVPNAALIAVVLNGAVWCFGIFAQAKMQKEPCGKALVLDIVSSFVFSLGIGFVFAQSGLFIYPFLAHFCERFLSKTLIRFKYRT